MKTIHVESTPDMTYGKSSELASYDVIPEGPDMFCYWYATAPYEGSGQYIARQGEKWCCGGLYHCSCYGPTERIRYDWKYDSLAELESDNMPDAGYALLIATLRRS